MFFDEGVLVSPLSSEKVGCADRNRLMGNEDSGSG